jgi:two-component system nitrogen regulation response regulator GlnG
MKPIWIVDDDQSIRFVLEKALAREQFQVRSFSGPRDVLAALESDEPQVLVSDIRMPGGSGIDLLAKVKERLPGLPVIIMTAYSDLDSAVSAFQGGAFEYLPKPFDLPKAVELIRRAVEESLREEVGDAAQAQMPEMLGQAPAMQDVFRAIGRLSQSHGHGADHRRKRQRQGTGGARAAQAQPRGAREATGPSSPSTPRRSRRTCWKASCSATSAAPSPAHRPRAAAASSRPTAARSSSTRSATCPSTCRRGCCACCRTASSTASAATSRSRANVRVIAATHQNLEERVRQGAFREDLFHRLNVIRLRLPALRERREDIPMLARHFLQKSARELGVEAKRFTDAALEQLQGFDFPGNVRQLENICHWLTVMAPAQVVEPKDLPPELQGTPAPGAGRPSAAGRASRGHGAGQPPAVTPGAMEADHAPGLPPVVPAPGAALAPMPAAGWLATWRSRPAGASSRPSPRSGTALTRQFEGRLIQTALSLTRGRRIEAAQRLGIGRNTITRKIQELGLDE